MGFKNGFLWGTATAAFQIEGAYNEDGKGLSVWDVFCHEGGNVFDEHTGDTACDHYHLFRDDVKLMKELGIQNYRFSIAWPRLFPNGVGEPNEKGVVFYNALIDTLVENGITPYVTLFHWDYPWALEQMGGWQNPKSPLWFENYAAFCAKAFGDRVKHFITFNEPQCFIGLGYQQGVHAPGLHYHNDRLIPMAHHVLMAHGLATKAIRQQVKDAQIGYAPCGDPCVPYTNAKADIDAARKAYFAQPASRKSMFSISWWSDPVVLGTYPEDGLKLYEKYLPKTWQEDLKTICQPLDFYAQNLYNGRLIAEGEDGQPKQMTYPVGTPKTGMDWFVCPDALYWGPKFLYERYQLPFLISENGMSNCDTLSLDGMCHDPQRQDYLNRYIKRYRDAAEDGVDAIGYFQWSFLDNFEWAKGYHDRFGMVYVDYQTHKRTPKDSAYWYRQVMRENGDNL